MLLHRRLVPEREPLRALHLDGVPATAADDLVTALVKLGVRASG